MIPVLERNSTKIELAADDHLWLESVYLIGGLIGVPLTVLSVDKFGRKQSIILSALTALLSWIIIAVANSVLHLYIARFLVGISGDVSFVAVPMYVAEIADKNVRGFLSGMIYVMFLVGVLIIYAVGPIVEFYVPSFIGSVLVLIPLTIFFFMPDSPYYLVSKGKEDKAKKQLKQLRSADNVETELSEIVAAIKRQEAEKGRPQDLLIDKGNRKAVIILLVLNAAQHFSSISVILMNLHKILTVADSIYLSAYSAGIIFSALMLVAAILADVVVDKFGRRLLLIVSSILSGICIFALAVYFTLQKYGVDVKSISWIPVVSVMMYGFCFKLGLGIVPIVMTAELFPAKVKALGMAAADAFYLCFAWLSIEVYQRLIIFAGYDYPFYIFAVCCFLSALFTVIYIPETKGKSLEEIQFILKNIPFEQPNNDFRSNVNVNSKNVERNLSQPE